VKAPDPQISVGAVAGCELLIWFLKNKAKIRSLLLHKLLYADNSRNAAAARNPERER
jgi:hypothetical protein